MLGDGCFEGESTSAKSHETEVLSFQIDLIPIPRLADADVETNSDIAVLVVEPDYLAPIAHQKDQRNLQRIMLAQFLQSWWIREVAPRPDLPARAWAGMGDKAKWPTSQTLAKLVKFQTTRVKAWSRGELGGIATPDALKAPGSFWVDWNPHQSNRTLSQDDLRSTRRRGEAMVDWWVLWIEAHHTLEHKRIADNRTELGRTEAESFRGWITNQRTALRNEGHPLRELRDLSTEAFLQSIVRPDSRMQETERQSYLVLDHKSLLCFSLALGSPIPDNYGRI